MGNGSRAAGYGSGPRGLLAASEKRSDWFKDGVSTAVATRLSGGSARIFGS